MNGGRILVVDDSASIRAAIRETLAEDYAVLDVPSGEVALERVYAFRPDMILLDVMMGGMDGYTVCRKLRADGALGFVKILMVSSRATLEERLTGYEAGADDYLGKPFKPEELMAKVRVFMRLKTVEDELFAINEKLNEQVRVRTEQLVHSEKMAAIGRYAAGIVHNLNNPLQAIMGNAELLAMQHPDNKRIMNMRKAAAQMKRIIGAILSAGSLRDGAELAPVDLNEVIHLQLEFFRSNRFFKHEVLTRVDLSPLPPLWGQESHFSQILGNLIKNAIEAMHASDKRELTIQSRCESDTILIRLSDTGHGITEAVMKRIFNPFFTTKPLTAADDRPTGTGLGLASAREMVEAYGGGIDVVSEPGRGSAFTIRLPLSGKP